MLAFSDLLGASGKPLEPKTRWFRRIYRLGDARRATARGGSPNSIVKQFEATTFWVRHAPTPLFHCCRWCAAHTPVRRVMVFSGNGNDQTQRRGEAGHSNCFGQGGTTPDRFRYPS